MSEKFLGQIIMASFGFPPKGLAMCNGQFLPINQNQALFSLLGTNYGGNGQTTFALPDLRGRTPVGFASSADPGWPGGFVQIGERGGAESVTLTPSQLPAHSHNVAASTGPGNSRVPSARVYAQNTGAGAPAVYGPANGPLVGMNPAAVSNTGGNQPHTNMQPYATMNFCIVLTGAIFPSRT